MAHRVWPPEEEIQRMRDNGVYVAHCPKSTPTCPPASPGPDLSGTGIPTGLGTDVAGGAGESVFRPWLDAIQVSKLRWSLVDETCKPLTAGGVLPGNKGRRRILRKAGSFEEGYELDALVLDDREP